MVREVLTVSCGQAGLQLVDTLWREYCAEHGVLTDGTNRDTSDNSLFRGFVEEINGGLSVPSNSSLDLEPNVIDNINNGDLANVFHEEFSLNNFASGHYTVGKEIIDQVNERIRILIENCDNVQGFVLNHSVGTGSGLGALLLERMAVDYIWPNSISFNVFESYNALLAIHWSWLLNDSKVSLMWDNEAMYGLCQNNLNIKCQSFDNVNRLIAKFSSSTVPFPRPSSIVSKLNDFDIKPQVESLQLCQISSMCESTTQKYIQCEYKNLNRLICVVISIIDTIFGNNKQDTHVYKRNNDNMNNGINNDDFDTYGERKIDANYKYDEISEVFLRSMDPKDYISDNNVDNISVQTDEEKGSQREEFDDWLLHEKNNNTENKIITMPIEQDDKCEKNALIPLFDCSDPSVTSNASRNNSLSNCDSIPTMQSVDARTQTVERKDCQVTKYGDKSRDSIELTSPIENENQIEQDSGKDDDDIDK